jgi:hypothetical protein
MKTTASVKKLWTCPECGRQFERTGQTHSCRLFPVALHFKGKPEGKLLYNKFKAAVKKQTGPFKTESLECCIHFVSTFTFAAVRIFKDKIRVDFGLSRRLKDKRFYKIVQLSANRYLYYADIFDEDDIDKELMQWILEANDIKKEKTEERHMASSRSYVLKN